MWEFILLSKYLIIQWSGLLVAVIFGTLLTIWVVKKLHSKKAATFAGLTVLGVIIFYVISMGPPNVFGVPFSLKTYGPKDQPVFPLESVFSFYSQLDKMERVEDIAADPSDVPPPIDRATSTTVDIELTAKEVLADVAPGVVHDYWTFDGQVPGPFLRVREGDMVNLTLSNDPSSIHHHSIDLHAVTGPGGGAAATAVKPGESKSIEFKATKPGLYVYHCASENVATHMAHGMYGLILVEPKEGMTEVDEEYYVMQGELYTTGDIGKPGLQVFDARAMLEEDPTYFTFNGKVNGLGDDMQADVGDDVRLYVGNGGVAKVSSFHVIGEIMDTVYREGAIDGDPAHDLQTTTVPAGGATIADITLDVPGDYVLVDHALARMDRGAWGVLHAEGKKNPEIFNPGTSTPHDHDH